MGVIASQITSPMIVYSTVYSDADQRKHQISASLAFVRGIHRVPVNSSHKGPVTRKMFPFDDVIMTPGSAINLFKCTSRWRVLKVALKLHKRKQSMLIKQHILLKTDFTLWAREMQMRIKKWAIFFSENGLPLVQCQAIIWIDPG